LQMPEQKQKPKPRRESLASNHRLIVDDGRQVASNKGENEAARPVSVKSGGTLGYPVCLFLAKWYAGDAEIHGRCGCDRDPVLTWRQIGRADRAVGGEMDSGRRRKPSRAVRAKDLQIDCAEPAADARRDIRSTIQIESRGGRRDIRERFRVDRVAHCSERPEVAGCAQCVASSSNGCLPRFLSRVDARRPS
jgi:hypothetical protein